MATSRRLLSAECVLDAIFSDSEAENEEENSPDVYSNDNDSDLDQNMLVEQDSSESSEDEQGNSSSVSIFCYILPIFLIYLCFYQSKMMQDLSLYIIFYI